MFGWLVGFNGDCDHALEEISLCGEGGLLSSIIYVGCLMSNIEFFSAFSRIFLNVYGCNKASTIVCRKCKIKQIPKNIIL